MKQDPPGGPRGRRPAGRRLRGGVLADLARPPRPPGQQSGGRRSCDYSCPMHPAYHLGPPRRLPLLRDAAGAGVRGRCVGGRRPLQRPPPGASQISAERQQAIGVAGRASSSGRSGPQLGADARPGGGRRTRVYRITAATNGWIEKALPNTVGSLVRKDEVLATYYARESLSAQQALLLRPRRPRPLPGAEGLATRRWQSTNVQIQQATDTLRALGMTRDADRGAGEDARAHQHRSTCDRPPTAFVLERNITEGQRFETGFELLRARRPAPGVGARRPLRERPARADRPGKPSPSSTAASEIRGARERRPAASSTTATRDAESPPRARQPRLPLPSRDVRGRGVPVELPETLTVPARGRRRLRPAEGRVRGPRQRLLRAAPRRDRLARAGDRVADRRRASWRASGSSSPATSCSTRRAA